ncbi:hypothetical protein DO021_16690 [Desulfobacter hydrogenophilus]|uniref:Uncharacterized protein n=1 Tax=Desulfobacter hydrogenophilus TaxID=2291 RepID=A0A328F8B8_9BACT|nr:hypothetical protein [Desulfobacter hydrogenophilus]NDY73051.1 hypothetical protein [Desulfobacter hydrogenophilus]QBH14699.1 hypothetical protein EYB58_18295 [Desulfobacter hydrogenophilus]RAM00898.1 hypothetical protein DO021_16690 [Desulfobacter hydrogenophilus]
MYFKITYSAIYNWKGSGTEREQNDPNLMDSFCHLIIAQEATTEATWITLIDQGEDTGVPTTNCIHYIIPRICERFKLKIANLRVFEVWPYHQGDLRLKYTEVVISDISFDDDNERVLRNSWRPTDDQDAKILDQLIKTVGDKVICEEV